MRSPNALDCEPATQSQNKQFAQLRTFGVSLTYSYRSPKHSIGVNAASPRLPRPVCLASMPDICRGGGPRFTHHRFCDHPTLKPALTRDSLDILKFGPSRRGVIEVYRFS